MKKIFPIILAAIVFVAALILLRPAPSRVVVVAASDLRAGYVLQDKDLALMSVPASALASDVIVNKAMLIGQPLRIDRGQGDVIRASQIGNLIKVEANERAIAVRVTDSTGAAGLLVPGQSVGVIASIPQQDTQQQSGTFSKATIEGLRVLYIDPTFAANMEANTVPQATPGPLAAGLNTKERAREGSVLLAVPTGLQTVFYDFSAEGAVSQTRNVNALELLAALSGMDGATITLYLMPQDGNAAKFTSPGLWLPDLITTPFPTPTPTAAPAP
ncbi:MAG: Flp pilus assembly protein CpaB [Chloroflexi bacterium]|nr:Flp pilus assembly protein CpaB [Chloroflexota bacterium]MBI3340768.1 Flp pilus assembly protein CpaB [Chloroflexota bacterium]